MSPALWAYFIVYSLFSTATLAQTTHTVTVGANGSFYDPPTLSAGLNDLVVFIFEGPSHGVIQCALEKPCFPLPGGFSSGFAGRGENGSAPAPRWTLEITDISQPIWFYCANTVPVSHCESGMVGAINPPSITAYDDFRAVAERVSVLPSSLPTVATVGLGAFATAPPEVPLSAQTPSASSSDDTQSIFVPTTSTSTATPSSSPSHASAAATSSKTGAIVGGSVGGAVALVIVFLALVICLRRRRQRNSRNFFHYAARSPEFDSPKELVHTKLVAPPPDVPHSHLQSSNWATPSVGPILPASAPLVPQRYNPRNAENTIAGSRVSQASVDRRHSRPQLPPVMMEHKTSAGSLPSRNRDSTSGEKSGGPPFFHATVRGVVLRPHSPDSSSQASGIRTESPAPPRYHPI